MNKLLIVTAIMSLSIFSCASGHKNPEELVEIFGSAGFHCPVRKIYCYVVTYDQRLTKSMLDVRWKTNRKDKFLYAKSEGLYYELNQLGRLDIYRSNLTESERTRLDVGMLKSLFSSGPEKSYESIDDYADADD